MKGESELPDIDVIIPAYNAQATLAATLESVLSQTQRPGRVILVDDGSQDATAELAERFAPSVTIARQPNGGQGSARAHGARLSDAELLLFIDADDVLLPTALADLRRVLSADPKAPLAYGQALTWSGNAPPTPGSDDLPFDTGDDWRRLLRHNFIRTPGCVLMRRSALESVGGWDVDRRYIGNEDWDLWLRLARIGRFAGIDQPVLWYRTHGGGFSGNRRKMEASQRRMAAKHRRFGYDQLSARLVHQYLRPVRTSHHRPARLWELGGAAAKRFRFAAVACLWALATRRLMADSTRPIRRRVERLWRRDDRKP